MQFIDESKIYIKSGNGGQGCLSFLREAHMPFGGPDGGNGGIGGNVIFKANKSVNTLIDYRFKQHFKAGNGAPGKSRNRNGKNGQDIILIVPVGTQILTESNKIITDLDHHDQEIILLEGGKGGLGNAAFKTSLNRSPRKFQKGIAGQELIIKLHLKIISDIGIIGFPNSGKSTLLSTISSAKPKIADYPFTTLQPKLGVIYVDEHEFVMADIPGLIAGASQGTGLGHKFLKHIERCKALLHLIDITNQDIVKSYKIIRNELQNYSPKLSEKKELIALNKIDLLNKSTVTKIKNNITKELNIPVMTISAATQQNITNLKRNILKTILPRRC